MYNYNANLTLGEVALNVKDLEKQKNFYKNIIGLSILEENDKEVVLGILETKKKIIRLLKTNKMKKNSAGLYHTAILVETRSELGRVLKHLFKNSVALEGGADHGYSEAIYLQDLEGNGIEIYADKDASVWDKRDNGKIVGVTEALDVENLLKEADEVGENFKLKSNTTVGHVHLKVINAQKSSEFYQKIFNMTDKFSVKTASWIANGDYHHHLALNNWQNFLTPRESGEVGIEYFTVIYDSKENYLKTLEKVREYIVKLEEDKVVIVDNVGIKSVITYKK